jgi:hypothetical protein
VIPGVKTFFEGQTVDADQMDFKVEAQLTGRFHIEDGATVELRHAVKNVYRLRDKKKPDGSPVYVLIGEASTNTTFPDGQQGSAA